jgi:Hint domain
VQIDATFDSSVLSSSAATEIENAVDYVVNLYDSLFSSPITINIDVGWGEVDGQTLESDALGESISNTSDYSYSQVVNALTRTADTSGDSAQLAAVSTLSSDSPPTSGTFAIADAEAQALGLMSGTPTVDGYVGFDSNSSIWSFSPTTTPAAGEYYFIGVAEHEISEVMGRMSDIGSSPNTYSVMDLFRYSAPGVRDLTAGSSHSNSTAYFSINGGETNLGTWNNIPRLGDTGDWKSPDGPTPNDAFNAASSPGVINALSTNDVTLMNVLGYDTTPLCLMPGTKISTPKGEIAVETLSRGDLVVTTDGRAAPVAWIGRCTVSTRFADPLRVLPIRIRADALGDNTPSCDLLLSPDHAVLVDGVLVHASALVNGSSIVRETNVPAQFTYYHIELEDHSLILAENTAVETFIDHADRLAFDNWQEHETLYPDGNAIIEMPYPRAKGYRQVPRSIRERLAERSALLVDLIAA